MVVQNCIEGTLAEYTATLSKRQAQHLLSRMGFGASLEDTNWATGKTPAQIVDAILNTAADKTLVPDVYEEIGWQGITEYIDNNDPNYPFYGSSNPTGAGVQRLQQLMNIWAKGMIGNNKTGATDQERIIDLATNAKNRLTLFWSNHFVVRRGTNSNNNDHLLTYYYTLNRNCLGDFKRFVSDIGRDPKMLNFLNGDFNNKTHFNENYARELLELFTMGVGNYEQQDIVEIARVFTGWRLDQGYPHSTDYNTFLFEANQHDWGTKVVFGQTITPTIPNLPNLDSDHIHWWEFMEDPCGDWIHCGSPDPNHPKYNSIVALASEEYDELHDIIFAQKADAIAKFICTKLYKYFVYEQVDNDIINGMANTFKNNNWNIQAVLQQLFKSQHFFNANAIGAKIKSPIDCFVSLYKNMGMEYFVDYFDNSYRYMSFYDQVSSAPIPYYSYDLFYDEYNESRNWSGTVYVWVHADQTGQKLFEPVNVAGWPGYRSWINEYNLTKRWELAQEHLDAWTQSGDSTVPMIPIETTYKIRQFLRDLTNTSNDPAVITEAVAKHFLMVDLEPEQLQVATERFKALWPDNYYVDGTWNLYYEDSSTGYGTERQFIDLMKYLVTLPEFQLT